MSISAHYVTQSGVWSTQYGKPLTDRRIAQLKAQGHYSSPFVQHNITELKRKRRQVAIEKQFEQF